MEKSEEKKLKRFIKECGFYTKLTNKLKEHNYYSETYGVRKYMKYHVFIKECQMENFINYAFKWDDKVWIYFDNFIRYVSLFNLNLVESVEYFKSKYKNEIFGKQS